MNRPSRHGKVDGATVVIIGIGLLLVLLTAIIIAGIVWPGGVVIPEGAEGPTEAEVIERTRKRHAATAMADKVLIAASQPAATLPADPKFEELRRQLDDQLKRANELEKRLQRALRSSTQPSTSPASSEPSFPTTPETRPTLPATRPADK